MNKTLHFSYWSFVFFTLIPLLIVFPLSLIQFFGDNSASLTFISFVSIVPLILYYYLSKQAIANNSDFTTILRVTFYVNFLLYMFAILVAFYFLIIGGFLFTGQTPIGLELEQEQAPYLLLIGIYLIAISSLGMIYLSKSKKIISS